MTFSLTEEAVFEPQRFTRCDRHDPGGRRGWRYYRVETGFECGCPEGYLWLPADVDPSNIEEAINAVLRVAKG